MMTLALAFPVKSNATPALESTTPGEFPKCSPCVHSWGAGPYIAGRTFETAAYLYRQGCCAERGVMGLTHGTVFAGFATALTGKPPTVALSSRNEQLPLPLHRRDATGDSLSKGAIAGIAVGSFVALLILVSLVYLTHRRLTQSRTTSEKSPRGGKGPRRTTSSLDFRCRTRVTPMASRADFRRLDSPPVAEIEKGSEKGKRMSLVGPADALGSNPVLASTLDEDAAASPLASDGVSWDGPTLCSPGYSPPYTNSAKWASPSITATISSPQVPIPAYSPQRVSPPAASATASSTNYTPLLPAEPIDIPAMHSSVSPSGQYGAVVGYRPLYTLDELEWGPTRALRTRGGEWDLHARSRELESGGKRTVSTEGSRVKEAAETGIIPVGFRG